MISTASINTNQNWVELLGYKREAVSVLIIGNNPIEMTTIYNILSENRSKYYVADVCFDIHDSVSRIIKNKPQIILLDDNIDLKDSRKLILQLKGSSKTKRIPVIILKSTNWSYDVFNEVEDYLLKETINSEILEKAIEKNLNSKNLHIA